MSIESLKIICRVSSKLQPSPGAVHCILYETSFPFLESFKTAISWYKKMTKYKALQNIVICTVSLLRVRILFFISMRTCSIAWLHQRANCMDMGSISFRLAQSCCFKQSRGYDTVCHFKACLIDPNFFRKARCIGKIFQRIQIQFDFPRFIPCTEKCVVQLDDAPPRYWSECSHIQVEGAQLFRLVCVVLLCSWYDLLI